MMEQSRWELDDCRIRITYTGSGMSGSQLLFPEKNERIEFYWRRRESRCCFVDNLWLLKTTSGIVCYERLLLHKEAIIGAHFYNFFQLRIMVTNVRTPVPLGPLGMYSFFVKFQAVPAISRCAQGVSPTNFCR